MAKKSSTTTLLSNEKQTTFYDLVDEKLSHQSKVELEAKKALFENNHKADNLNKVYDEIDKELVEEQLDNEVEEENFVNNSAPFFGDNDALTKLRRHNYVDVVDNDRSAITLEIKQKNQQKNVSQYKNKRKILWASVASICVAVVLGLTIYNSVLISNELNSISETEKQLQSQNQQLENNTYTYEQIVEQLGDSISDVIQGMTKVEGGTMVSLEPIIEVVQPSAPTSFFDKLCNFFAKLFGR